MVVEAADPPAEHTATSVIPGGPLVVGGTVGIVVGPSRLVTSPSAAASTGGGEAAPTTGLVAGYEIVRRGFDLIARKRRRPVEHADAHGVGLANHADIRRSNFDGQGDHALAGVGRADHFAEVPRHGRDNCLDEYRRRAHAA